MSSWAVTIGFLDIRWVDVADILIVAVIMYALYRQLRGGVAGRILAGGLVLYVIYLGASAAGMELLTGILGQIMGVGVLAALIIFQQEVRKFLLLLGKGSFWRDSPLIGRWLGRSARGGDEASMIQPALDAAKQMALQHTGGLIVFAHRQDLTYYVDTGDYVDAVLSKRLLLSIFFKNSPMHDGAAIVVEGRLRATRCILPVSDTMDLPAHLGLRHRAALGMSEATDAAVLIISEESGQIALAIGGELETNLTTKEVRARLVAHLTGQRRERPTTAEGISPALPHINEVVAPPPPPRRDTLAPAEEAPALGVRTKAGRAPV